MGKKIDLEHIIKMYGESIEDDLANLEKIDPYIIQQCETLLKTSQYKTTQNWVLGKKTIRTLHVAQAFSENYPEDILRTSIEIDAIVNHLDDLFDEKLDKKNKVPPIIEIFRLLANSYRIDLNREMKSAISKYYDNIVVVAASEGYYYDLIKSSRDVNEMFEYSKSLYDCRSLDMDVFVELPAIRLHADADELTNLKKIARAYRSLNLIKKDMKDYEHDIKNENETIITLLSERKLELEDVIKRLSRHYMKISNDVPIKGKFSLVIANFRSMIKRENRDLESTLRALMAVL